MTDTERIAEIVHRELAKRQLPPPELTTPLTLMELDVDLTNAVHHEMYSLRPSVRIHVVQVATANGVRTVEVEVQQVRILDTIAVGI